MTHAHDIINQINQRQFVQAEVTLNGQEVTPLPKDYYQYIAELGNQGWELVSTSIISGGWIYYFKRPKP